MFCQHLGSVSLCCGHAVISHYTDHPVIILFTRCWKKGGGLQYNPTCKVATVCLLSSVSVPSLVSDSLSLSILFLFLFFFSEKKIDLTHLLFCLPLFTVLSFFFWNAYLLLIFCFKWVWKMKENRVSICQVKKKKSYCVLIIIIWNLSCFDSFIFFPWMFFVVLLHMTCTSANADKATCHRTKLNYSAYLAFFDIYMTIERSLILISLIQWIQI